MINCQLGSLFDQKTIAILGFRNPLRCFTAAAPRRAALRIAIFRRNRSAGARCNGAPSTENLFGCDVVFGNLFTDRGDDSVEFGKSSLFRLLCQCVSLRFKFEISRHIWSRIPLLESGAGSNAHSFDALLRLVKSPLRHRRKYGWPASLANEHCKRLEAYREAKQYSGDRNEHGNDYRERI